MNLTKLKSSVDMDSGVLVRKCKQTRLQWVESWLADKPERQLLMVRGEEGRGGLRGTGRDEQEEGGVVRVLCL